MTTVANRLATRAKDRSTVKTTRQDRERAANWYWREGSLGSAILQWVHDGDDTPMLYDDANADVVSLAVQFALHREDTMQRMRTDLTHYFDTKHPKKG